MGDQYHAADFWKENWFIELSLQIMSVPLDIAWREGFGGDGPQ